ncbi:MAG: DUF4157 domain-containing protein [Ilumatobacter sp.]|uniref:eCIS core domain-containing protein n=1 Tax=Ilumatobacter sp. TaxID=1967498 RepID=UPI00391B0CC6
MVAHVAGVARKTQDHEDEEAAGFGERARDELTPPPRPSIGRAITQAKLAVGPVDDPYEREADLVADAVVRRFAGAAPVDAGDAEAATVASGSAPTSISRVMRSSSTSSAAGAAGGELEPSIEGRIQRASGGGQPLDESTRGRFESAMGADFGGVKVHANSQLAPEIGAHAFTHGSDVHFAPGAYDPGSTAGQHLLAHELTHVVQQTGTAQRVQAKLWDAKTFKERTAISSTLGFSNASTAQDVILSLLADYEKFIAKGFSSSDPAQAANAVSQIRAMQDVAQRWIKNRGEIYEDSTNFTLATLDQAKETYAEAQGGPAASERQPTAQNPKAERMRGLQAFIQLCDSEIALLSSSLSDDALDGAAIDTTNKKYRKAVKRYPDCNDATSLFGKIGELAEMTVGAPGSSASLEIEGSIPVQPGVYVTIGIGGSAEKDTGGTVKLRGDVKVGVKGSIAGAAELSASLGGYIEAQGKSGTLAATLMSYALYRRGREGSAPTEVISMLWGGTTGKAGLARSEAWSRQLEEQVWGEGADGADDAYVESGATGAVGASFGDEDAVSGELSGGAFTGRRVDKQSLMERKGGAGAQNVRSDSIFNAGERQKRVGSEVMGWNVGGKVAAFGFSLELGVSRTGRTIGGGASGITKTTEWEDIEVSVNGAGPMPPALDLGATVWKLAEKIVRKAEEAAAKQGDSDTAGTQALLTGLAKMSPKLFTPKTDIPASTNLTIGFKISGSDWEVTVGTEKTNEIKLPDILKVELKRTQTFFSITSKGGAITTWYLGK